MLHLIPLERQATPYAFFNPNMRHIARNSKGVLVSVLVSRSLAFDDQVVRIIYFTPDLSFSQVVYEAHTLGINPVITASSSGEFHALMFTGTSELTSLYWSDITQNKTPVSHAFTTTGEGKYASAWDDVNRILYLTGQTGKLRKFNGDASSMTETQAVSNQIGIGNELEYPALHVDGSGTLHWFWVTITGNNFHYRSIQYMYSEDLGGSFKKPGSASTLTQPVIPDESGSSLALLPSLELGDNTFMNSSLVDSTHLHILYSWVPGFATRFYPDETIPYLRTVYRRFLRSTGVQNAHIPNVGRADGYAKTGAAGDLFIRGGNLYTIIAVADRQRIEVLKWDEASSRFIVYDRYPAKEVFGSGFFTYLGIEEGGEGLSDLLGVVEWVNTTPNEWSLNLGNVEFATTQAFMFRFEP